MSNPDNIAENLMAASAKAAVQENEERRNEKRVKSTAGIDKVSAVEPADQPREEAGLSGAARTVSPAPGPTFAEEGKPKFGQTVMGAIAIVNNYEFVMGRNSFVTIETIDSEQAKLYLALNAIVKVESSSDFMGGMEFLFRKFKDSTGAFGGDMVRRRVSYMKQPAGDKAMAAYMGFIDLLQVFSDPKGRKVLWPRFNKKLALEFAPAGEKRQRLETYMARICS